MHLMKVMLFYFGSFCFIIQFKGNVLDGRSSENLVDGIASKNTGCWRREWLISFLVSVFVDLCGRRPQISIGSNKSNTETSKCNKL